MSFVVIMLLWSLLITALVQFVVAIFGLRGWNLHHGVKRLLENIDPDLKEHSAAIAKVVLEHPSIAPVPVIIGGRRKASAIRPEELLRILRNLSQPKSPAPNGVQTAAKDKETRISEEARTALHKAVNEAGDADPQDLQNRISTVVSEMTKLFPDRAQAVQDAINRGLIRTSRFESQAKLWFDTVMDRTSERFLLYTRWITAVLAFALAIGLHVDSIRLFKQLSGSPELRAKLIQSADATLQQAGVIVADQQNPEALASEAIRAIGSDLRDEGDRKLVAAVPDGLITRKEGRDWLMKNIPEAGQAEALVAFNRRFEDATLSRLEDLSASFKDVKSSLDTAGIQLTLPKAPESEAFLSPGVLMTGLFLSLGAPFWFNALKQLANLRPAIAGKVEKKEQPKS